VTYPNPGDYLILISSERTIEVLVRECPYEQKRAVSKIFFEYVNEIPMSPDLIDNKGRLFIFYVIAVVIHFYQKKFL